MKIHHLVLASSLVTVSLFAHPGHSDEEPDWIAVASASEMVRQNKVSITIEGTMRVIQSNGIPNHATGQFPNSGNPNTIAPQNYNFRVPAQPQAAAQPTPLGMYPFGVAVNGVVFDPGAAEWWRGDRNWQYEPLSGAIKLGVDQNNAHVQPNGAYHYHGMPKGLLDKLTGGRPQMALLGWAADGFPIYGPWGHTDLKNAKSALKKMTSSYRVKKGARAGGPGGTYDGSFVRDYEFVKGAGDLDESNGTFGVTPEFPQGTYHYYLTDGFPFIPREFHGTPDPSFFRKGPPPGRPGQRPGRRPPFPPPFPPPDAPRS